MSGNTIITVIAAVAGSSVTTVFLNHYLTEGSSKKKKEKAERYLATTICFSLEKFVIAAASDHADTQDALNSGGDIGRIHLKVKLFPNLPISDHYELLDNEMLNRILDFPDRTILANGEISEFGNEVQDNTEIGIFASGKSRALATDALKLSEDIRSKYKLPKRELVYGKYNIRRWLDLEE